MQRDPRADLNDILEATAAIQAATVIELIIGGGLITIEGLAGMLAITRPQRAWLDKTAWCWRLN